MMKSHIEKRGDKPQSNLDFKIMSLCFAIRDKFKNPEVKLNKANIKQGDFVLDYGCGPGGIIIAAAEKAGPSGKVYAVDIHPLAIKKVKKKALKKGFKNVETILTDCKTGLENECIDVVICFDAFHCLDKYEENLREFHRILKPTSQLIIDDHHSEENEIISKIIENGLFKHIEKDESIYVFTKEII